MKTNNKICCDWDGFTWVWSFEKQSWLIDLEASGGPPSIHEKSPTDPPFIIKDEGTSLLIVPEDQNES